MAKIRIAYYGMDGEGHTLTEAKRDAGRKIEEALAGDYSPEIVTYPGSTYQRIVWRSPRGWYTASLNGDGHLSGVCLAAYSGEIDSRQEAVAKARMHVAQVAWRANMTEEEEAALIAWGGPELLDYFQWQRRYAEARARGQDDTAAREHASGIALR